MARNNYVAFKGSKEGLSICFNGELEYPSLKAHLIKKLESTKRFFEGAKVVSIQGKELSQDEKNEIKDIISTRFGMIMLEEEQDDFIDNPSRVADNIFEGIEEGNTKFIRSTLRSGQSLKFSGNIIVIGDVNPGAEVVAEGNILVMGALRGMAHAGSGGNGKAYVAAFSLQPTQLRIANIIARSPDNETTKPSTPELAMIKNDVILIEPYLPKK